jgi:non-ribosomal peptide synthetase component F
VEGAIDFTEASTGTEIDEELLRKVRSEAIDTDPLYGIFTSGSTGVPKGVVICHRGVIDMVEALGDTFGFDSEMVHANQAPFDFDVSVKDIYNAMKNGASIVVVPKRLFLMPKLLLEFLAHDDWQHEAVEQIVAVNVGKGTADNHTHAIAGNSPCGMLTARA